MFFDSLPVTGVQLVAGEVLEDSLPEKRIVWVFDEESGWIDVAAFLVKLSKIKEILLESIRIGNES